MMIAKISDLAAKILIEGWYQENLGEPTLVNMHLPPAVGDVFDLYCGYLTREVDGWYVSDCV